MQAWEDTPPRKNPILIISTDKFNQYMLIIKENIRDDRRLVSSNRKGTQMVQLEDIVIISSLFTELKSQYTYVEFGDVVKDMFRGLNFPPNPKQKQSSSGRLMVFTIRKILIY